MACVRNAYVASGLHSAKKRVLSKSNWMRPTSAKLPWRSNFSLKPLELWARNSQRRKVRSQHMKGDAELISELATSREKKQKKKSSLMILQIIQMANNITPWLCQLLNWPRNEFWISAPDPGSCKKISGSKLSRINASRSARWRRGRAQFQN